MRTKVNSIENYSEKCFKINGIFVPKSVCEIISENEIEIADWFWKKESNFRLSCTEGEWSKFSFYNETIGCFQIEIRKETENAYLIAHNTSGKTYEAWYPKQFVKIEGDYIYFSRSFDADLRRSKFDLI